MVDIFVGPQKQHFHIHRAVLVSRSDYFQSMFLSGFKEGKEKSATLPEDDPEVFDLFLQWIYGQKHLPPAKASANQEGTDFSIRIKLYGFAEKYCITELSNYLVSNLMSVCAHYRESPYAEEIAAAYHHTNSPSSPLRLLMIDFLYYLVEGEDEGSHWSAEKLSRALSENAQIMNDLILRIRKGGAAEDPSHKDPCAYHGHKNGEFCEWQLTL